MSNEPWGDVWFSKQHYAYELARLGYEVYFVNPTKKWRWANVFSACLKKEKINKNLTVLTYKNNLPQGRLSKFFVKVNDYLNCLKINSAIALKGGPTIWWKFDPYRFLNTYPLHKAKHIYHVVDPHLHLWQDRVHVGKADLIVSSSDKYINCYQEIGCGNIIKIPHGISMDEFELDKVRVREIEEKYNNFVIMIGAIAADVNIELLSSIARRQINVVIIGTESVFSAEWEEAKKMKHIHYLGEIHAKELKNYVAASKAGLIAYNFISKQKGQITRTPLKALNYLAQMKPIITTIDSEIPTLEKEGVYWAKNSTDYLSFVEKSINSELYIDTEKIKKYLSEHQYSKLINTILSQLEKC